MQYLISDASYPIDYNSSGNLVSENGFVHPRRNIDSFVLLLVTEGVLHITQGDKAHEIKADEFILLFPNTLHFGHKPCEGYLSYYWTHFYPRDPNPDILTREELLSHPTVVEQSDDVASTASPWHFIVPECGKLSAHKRSHLLFVQLLDFAKRGNYTQTWRCHYALSLLLLEVSSEAYQAGQILNPDIPVWVFDIMEWIRTHYDQQLTVASIAQQFDYHPTYLTNVFKKHTGVTVLSYLNQTRITASKNLLTDRRLYIYEIAYMCGFSDVKYFMKLFRRYEGITPSQYRKAFHQKKVNKT